MPSDKQRCNDPWYVRYTLISLTLGTVGLLILLPLVNLFVQAFAEGATAYWNSLFHNTDTRHSIFLTLMVAPVSVALNTVFGVAAAWTIARTAERTKPGTVLMRTKSRVIGWRRSDSIVVVASREQCISEPLGIFLTDARECQHRGMRARCEEHQSRQPEAPLDRPALEVHVLEPRARQ